jgi:hypothetical protein
MSVMKSEVNNQLQSHNKSLYKLSQSESLRVKAVLRIHFSPLNTKK